MTKIYSKSTPKPESDDGLVLHNRVPESYEEKYIIPDDSPKSNNNIPTKDARIKEAEALYNDVMFGLGLPNWGHYGRTSFRCGYRKVGNQNIW